MYTTREYTLLIGDGCEDVKILPNTPFKAFEGKYTVTSYALLKGVDTDEAIILRPGDKITGIGKVEKPKKSRSLRERAIDAYDNDVKEAFKASAPKTRRKKVVKDGK